MSRMFRQSVGYFLSMCLLMGGGAQAAEMTPEAVKQIIESYLKEKPEIIVEAMEELNRRQADEKQKKQLALIQEHQKDLLENAQSPFLGNPHGKKVIVTFFDYTCGHCKRAHEDLEKIIKNNSDLKIIQKDLPIMSKASYYAAVAARAAHLQGKYSEFQHALMQSNERLHRRYFKEVAQILNLDMAKFEKDVNDPALLAQVDQDIHLAETLSIDGTPTFIVNGQIIEGYPGVDELMGILLGRDALAGQAVGQAVAQAIGITAGIAGAPSANQASDGKLLEEAQTATEMPTTDQDDDAAAVSEKSQGSQSVSLESSQATMLTGATSAGPTAVPGQPISLMPNVPLVPSAMNPPTP